MGPLMLRLPFLYHLREHHQPPCCMPSLEDIDEDDDYVPVAPPPTQLAVVVSHASSAPPPAPVGNTSGNSDFDAFFGAATVTATKAAAVAPQPTLHVPPTHAKGDLDDFFSSSDVASSDWGTMKTRSQPSQHVKPQDNDFIDFSMGSRSYQSHKPSNGGGAQEVLEKLNLAAKGIHVRDRPTLSEMGAGAGSSSVMSNTEILANPALLKRMSHYEVLGIVNPQYCDEEDVNRQYKKKALLLHPDKFRTREGRCQTEDEESLFKAIVRAHEVLSDSVRRKNYDAALAHARHHNLPIDAINCDDHAVAGHEQFASPDATSQSSGPVNSPSSATSYGNAAAASPPSSTTLWDSGFTKPTAVNRNDLDDLFASPAKHPSTSQPQSQQASAWASKPPTSGVSNNPPSVVGGGYGGKQSTNIDDLFNDAW